MLRTDVERIVENILKDLSINVSVVNAQTAPDDRKVELRCKDVVICSTTFDVVQSPTD